MREGLQLPADRDAIARAARCKPAAIRLLQGPQGRVWRIPIIRGKGPDMTMGHLWVRDVPHRIVPAEEDLGWRAYKL